MKRNRFSLSHYKLLSGDMGFLLPIQVQDVLPGDTFVASSRLLIRLQALLAPVMHPVVARVHHWFVPLRLIWEDFESFITGGPDGLDASVYPNFATLDTNGVHGVGTLSDYLGIPSNVGAISASCLPFRAYALIWNENYRDEDLQAELPLSLASGADSTTNSTLQRVCWEKDYFTTARPWEQKGTAVTLPLGTTAPVELDQALTGVNLIRHASDRSLPTGNYTLGAETGTGDFETSSGVTDLVMDPNGQWYTDLSNATAASINQLREAFALQRYMENRARYGSRYTEYLRSIGVQSADARLQRPEYLGGGKQTLQFSEVLQTGPDSTDAGVGDLKGHGISSMRTNRFKRYFSEHGIVMSMLSVRPRSMYFQGVPKSWNRQTKEDYFQHELEIMGQAPILNREVLANHGTPNGTFGFQDRYDEYRRGISGVAGEFKTSLLNYWHMARDFASDPNLNAAFVSCTPTDRVFAATTVHQMQIMAHHEVKAARMLKRVARPGSLV